MPEERYWRSSFISIVKVDPFLIVFAIT